MLDTVAWIHYTCDADHCKKDSYGKLSRRLFTVEDAINGYAKFDQTKTAAGQGD